MKINAKTKNRSVLAKVLILALILITCVSVGSYAFADEPSTDTQLAKSTKEAKETLRKVLNMVQDFVTIGGSIWLIYGVIILALGLKDKNGPQLQAGIWQIIGGAMVIAASTLFATLVK